jgi:DNA invertase Pin-like site-specific DNA recombinase
MEKYAAIYVRVSTVGQAADDKTSLKRQLESCLAQAGRDGFIVPDNLVFKDVMSGARDDRPAFIKMNRSASNGEFGNLYVWSIDRLGRGDFRAMVNAWGDLKDAGVTIFSCQEGDISSHPIVFSTMSILASNERARIRERTLPAKLLKRDRGLWVLGRVPYGYRALPDQTLEQHPDHADIVKRIFREAIGYGSVTIAGRLNEDGIRAMWRNAASGWEARSVTQVLTNTMAYGVQSGVRYRIRPNPIISQTDFERVSAARAARYRKGKAPSGQWLLTGILKCECGSSYRHHEAKKRHYYVCRSGKAGSRCGSPSVRLDDAERQVISAVSSLLMRLDPDLLSDMLVRTTHARLNKLNAELAVRKNRLDEVERSWERLQTILLREAESGTAVSEMPIIAGRNADIARERRHLTKEIADTSDEIMRAARTDQLSNEETRTVLSNLQEARWMRVPEYETDGTFVGWIDLIDPVLAIKAFVKSATVGRDRCITSILYDIEAEPDRLQEFLRALIAEEIRKVKTSDPIPLLELNGAV